MDRNEMLQLLHENVVPALGCTEPVCVALAAADAALAVGGAPRSIQTVVSANVYKNGMSVGIAGFDRVGLHYAAALGALIAAPEKGLRLMEGVTPELAAEAIALAESGQVHIAVDAEKSGVFARCTVETEAGEGVSEISGGHTNIVLTAANGAIRRSGGQAAAAAGQVSAENLRNLKIAELRALAESASEEELAFLLDGVEMNETLADAGMQGTSGIGIAKMLQEDRAAALLGSGLMESIMVRVAAATEARLDGCPRSAMSSAGSGSKGVAVLLPIAETAKALHADRLSTLRALAFGHLVNEYMNVWIGKLSALCTCAAAAATAASAAITWLMGGTDDEIGFAIRNMTGSITGMICDGGKVGCALKLSTAVSAAMMSAALAVNGVGLRPSDGICAETPEECVRHISRLGNRGMVAADHEILRIMLESGRSALEKQT